MSGVTEQMSWWRWARLRQLNPMIPDSLLAGVLAVIGVSIHERVREIGLLRAVGMTRRQVRTAVRWESVLIALLGTAPGMSLAVLGSWGIVHALRDQSVTTFRLPFGQLIVIVAMAGVAGLVAAMGPPAGPRGSTS